MFWEYKTVKIAAEGFAFFGGEIDEIELDHLLNAHGKEGWELVTGFDTNTSRGRSRYLVYTFKRSLK